MSYNFTGSKNKKITTSESVIKFYYMKIDTSNDDYLVIEIEVSDSIYTMMLYMALILIIVSALFLFYSTIILVKCCTDRRSPRIVDPFQSSAWLSQSAERYIRIMNNCPESKYNLNDTKYGELSCVICLAAYEENDIVRTLNCAHVFHKECIEQWIKAQINKLPKCPACKVPVTDERPLGYVEPVN